MSLMAIFLILFCYGYAFVLMFDWLLHALPGGHLNPFRRFFFSIAYPTLKFSRGWMSFQWSGFDSRGLALAFTLWMIGRYWIPWLMWWGVTLKG
jgi:uncharacterized protein YggT (Ycf19 family)